MKNYEYQELIDIVKEVFGNYRNDAAKIGENNMQALSRFFVDFDCVINDGESESAIICSTLCIELSIIQEKTIIKLHYEKLLSVLQRYNPENIVGSISQNEIEQLSNQVKHAIQILNGMKVI